MVGTHERKGLFRRCQHRWEDDIKIDVKDTGWGGVDRTNLAQDGDRWWAVVSTVINPLGCIKCGEYIGKVEELVAFQEELLFHGVVKVYCCVRCVFRMRGVPLFH